jgi:hypothetical protein
MDLYRTGGTSAPTIAEDQHRSADRLRDGTE